MFYRVYYQFDGPSKSDPFRTLKSEEEIERALEYFPSELEVNLRPAGSVVVISMDGERHSLVIEVKSDLPIDRLGELLKMHLNDWDLFAEKLAD